MLITMNNYGNLTSWHGPDDAAIEDLLNAFLGLMVAHTYNERCVLEDMLTFAQEMLDAISDRKPVAKDFPEDDWHGSGRPGAGE